MALSIKKQLSEAQDLERQGKSTDAIQAYQQILKQAPGNAAALHGLAIFAFNANQLKEALDFFTAAVQSEPDNALYHRNLGELCRRLGKFDQAILCAKAAAKLDQKDAEPNYNLGLVYTDLGDITKAIAAYRKAVKINPKHGLAWNNLGTALEQQGNKKAALSAYEKAVAINPIHAEAQNNQGAIYSEMGKLDEARASFNAAIAAKPDFVEAHYNLSSLKTYTPDDPHLAMLEQVFARRDSLTIEARIRYAFAISKALDDIGRYDQAFAAYEEGNRLQHSILPVDEANADALVEAIQRIFTKEFFEKRKKWVGEVDKNRVPIFIVGMPRSGTTLLEQILSTHGSVYGAGELVDLNNVIQAATGAINAEPFANHVIHLTEENIREIGNQYLEKVWKLSPKSHFITDKMPANFFYAGLIASVFPNARIIHMQRHPIDTCLSIYFQNFYGMGPYANDLDDLAHYYQQYRQKIQRD
jgi:tetratricopeptide (TPR) repeat protein